MTLRPIVYHAGPDVFAPDCVERAKTYCAACADQNLKGLFPTPPLSTQLPKGDAAAAVTFMI